MLSACLRMLAPGNLAAVVLDMVSDAKFAVVGHRTYVLLVVSGLKSDGLLRVERVVTVVNGDCIV